MIICEPKRGFRQVDITDRRTKIAFAQCMKNIAEIELAVLSSMCLTQRIPDKDHLRSEVEANVNARNAVILYFQRNFLFEIIREYFNYYSIL